MIQSKKIFVDIDQTICFTPCVAGVNLYEDAVPWKNKISVINALYDAGHNITYYTARGSSSGADWYKLTLNQLNSWGCLYHDLIMGKPSYDIIIDDKALTSLSDWEAVKLGLIEI